VGAVLVTVSCGVHVNSSVRVGAGERHQGDLRTVNGSVKVADEAVVHGSGRTVNGSVTVGRGARILDLKTVNGRVRVGDGSHVDGDVETVNGSVEIGAETGVTGRVKTVNGGVTLGPSTAVAQDVQTVNGSLRLQGAEVGGSLRVRNGGIHLSGAALVRGDIVIEGSAKKYDRDEPLEIVMKDQARLMGGVVLDDPERLVIIRLSGEAAIDGDTGGAEVVRE